MAEGFVAVSAAQVLASASVSILGFEYVAPEGSRLTLTVPSSCKNFDLPTVVAALRGP